MLPRTLEPELMDDPHEVESYDEMDHAGVNQQFVADLLGNGLPGARVLDLGTGSALIAIELCKQSDDCEILGFDAAIHMLEAAKINVAVAGFEHRIHLHHGDAKNLEFDDGIFDCVISNSLIHHLRPHQEPLHIYTESRNQEDECLFVIC